MNNLTSFKIKKLLLFGGNRKNENGPLLNLALKAIKFIDEIVIFTDEQHFNLSTQNGVSFGQKLEGKNITGLKWILTEKIDVPMLSEHVTENTLGLLINSNWIVKQDIIDIFKGRLFNYHNTRLPEERGAAAYSWKILSGSQEGGITVHKVVAKLDAGDIVKKKDFLFPEECRVSSDYYKYMEKLETSFLIEFLEGKDITCIQQKESDSVYMPKLNTLTNGFINWEWTAEEIELFIRAFDDPHDGASTYFHDARLHLKKCFLTDREKTFHPFQAGIIYRKNAGSIFIAAKGGGLEIKEVFNEKGEDILSEVKLGHRFNTPQQFLDNAKLKKKMQNQ